MIETIPIPFIGDGLAQMRIDRFLRPFFTLVERSGVSLSGDDAIVVVSVAGDREREWALVSRYLRRHPHSYAVVIVPDPRTQFRLERQDRSGRMRFVLLPGERETLISEFHPIWFEAEAARLERITYAVPSLPAVLLGALRMVLRSRLKSPPPLTITELARSVGVSRGYLSRAAKTHSIPLSELTHTWLSLLAMDGRFATEYPWERIALQCGYASASGLTQLFRVYHGFAPSRCGRGDYQQAVVRFRERVLDLLRGVEGVG